MHHEIGQSGEALQAVRPIEVGENRSGALFAPEGEEPRTIHLGIDVFAPAGTDVITPLNVYLAVMVGFAQKYQKDAGIGTIVALMLPYTATMMVLWTLLLIGWTYAGLPLGPA